ELSNIRAGVLTVGGVNTSAIQVNGVPQAGSKNIGQVIFRSLTDGSSISFVNSPSVFQSMSAIANNGITVQADLKTVKGDLYLDGDADNKAAAALPADNIAIGTSFDIISAGSIKHDATTGAIS